MSATLDKGKLTLAIPEASSSLASRESLQDLSGANGPSAKTLATAAATAQELKATKSGIDVVKKEAAGISSAMEKKVTGKQDEIKKLEASLDEEAKKGPISKERADYYRQELTRIRTEMKDILTPNTDAIGETANQQWDLQQRFVETQQQVLAESQRMLLDDQRSGNFKTYFRDFLKDGGYKLSDKGYYPFGNNDLVPPLDPFRGVQDARNPFSLEQGRFRPELKVDVLLDGTPQFDFPGLKPREGSADKLRLGSGAEGFGGFNLNPGSEEPFKVRLPLQPDKSSRTLKLDDSLMMPAGRNGGLETDYFMSGKVARALDIKQAYDAKLSPEERRAFGYASDILKQPVTQFNRQQLEQTVAAEKANLLSKSTTLENATNPMLDRLNGKISLAETQGLANFHALDAFGADAANFSEKGVGAYREQMGLAQKDIDVAKTIETEFHSKETPHKVIPDDKVDGVRKQFQDRVLAGDKATENPAFMTAYEGQVRQAKALYGEQLVTDLQQIVMKGGGEKEIAALFKDKPNAAGDILYASTLAGSMGKILDVDKARLSMVAGQASTVVSQSEFKAERNRMILENQGDFTKRMIAESNPIGDVIAQVDKSFADQGVVTKAGLGIAFAADATIQNDLGLAIFDNVSDFVGGPQIRPAMKFTTIDDLNKMVRQDLNPLSEKMRKYQNEISDLGTMLKSGKLGGPGQISREEAERRIGVAWEEHLKLRTQAQEQVQKYSEFAEKTLQNGKLAKDLTLAGATLALAIPTGGQSLWALGAVGAAVKAGSTALDTATSAKGFDLQATVHDGAIGFLEMAAGGGVGKIGSFTGNTILKTSGATLGRRALAYGAEVGINTLGGAGVATIDPLIRAAAEGKPINPEELKQRALMGGLFGGGITAGLRAPALVRGNPNLPPKVGVSDTPDGPSVASAEIDPKTGLPVKKADASFTPVRPDEPATPVGTNKEPVQPVPRVELDESSVGAARARANDDFKYNVPADQAEKMVKDQANAMGFEPEKVKVTISDKQGETALTRFGDDGMVEVVLPKNAQGKVRVNELFHESSQIKTYQTAGNKSSDIIAREMNAQETAIANSAKLIKDQEASLQQKLAQKSIGEAERKAAEAGIAQSKAAHQDALKQMDGLKEQLKARELIDQAEVAASKLNDARQTAQRELEQLRAPTKSQLDKALQEKERLSALAAQQKDRVGTVSDKTQKDLQQANETVEKIGKDHAQIKVSESTQKALDDAEAAYRATELEQSAFQAEHGKMKDYITDVWEKGASGQKPDGSPRTNNPDAFDGKTSEISRQVERAEMLASPEKRALAISEKLYGSDAPKTLPEAEEQFVKMGFNKNDPDLKKALETKFSPEKNNGAVATETSGSRLDKPAAEKRLEDLGGEQMGITERQGYKGLKGNVYKLPDEEAKRIQEVILNDPNLSPKIKDIIRAYSPKSLRFTYDLVGHGNSTFKIFGLSGKDANRLGSYDSNFKYTRL